MKQAGGASWAVPTGRRDGRISVASEASNLPGFRDSIAVQIQKFQDKRLNIQDLVTLVGNKLINPTNLLTSKMHADIITNIKLTSNILEIGGHTIGTSACQFFRDRLYNFNSTGSPDPTIDPTFLPTLQSLCPQNGDASRRVGLDNGSENQFDSSFFANLRDGRGVLETDQKLWSDESTRPTVQSYLGIRGLAGLSFSVEFGRAMVKMGNIEVMTGTNGEIRSVCSAIN